jgi:hypothetical protein
MFYRDLLLTNTLPVRGQEWCMWNILWREGYGRISGGMRVLEVAADSREATPGKGAHSTSTIAHEVEYTHPRE